MSIGELLELSRRNDELEKEIERLKRIIAKELTENDEIGSEYAYVVAMKEENTKLREALEQIAAPRPEYEVPSFCDDDFNEKIFEMNRKRRDIARQALGCLCQNGIRGRYCEDYHVRET